MIAKPRIILLALLLSSVWANAQTVPFSFSYQGRVVSPDTGQPLAGARTLTFRLYSVPSGGSAEWARQYPVTLGDNGAFSVLLEDAAAPVPSGPTNELTNVFSSHPNLFLSLEVSGTAGESALRLQLVSAPYAMKAEFAETAETAETATVASGGLVEQINEDGSDGGFVIPSTVGSDTLRIDPQRIESSGSLQLRPMTNGYVEIGTGGMQIGGLILNEATSISLGSNTAATDGFLIVGINGQNVTVTIEGIAFRTELLNEDSSANRTLQTYPIAKGEQFSVTGAGSTHWQPMGQ